MLVSSSCSSFSSYLLKLCFIDCSCFFFVERGGGVFETSFFFLLGTYLLLVDQVRTTTKPACELVDDNRTEERDEEKMEEQYTDSEGQCGARRIERAKRRRGIGGGGRIQLMLFSIVAIMVLFIAPVSASKGDRLPEFKECVQVCFPPSRWVCIYFRGEPC